MTGDPALLRAFEPVIRFTQGELFFPSAVEPYLAASDLLVGSSQRIRREILGVGEVTPERLAAETAPPGEQLFLRLVQRPLDGLELVRWRQRPGRPPFRHPGRLARVGLFARLVDAGFNASLLLRGTVPGGTAAAAEIEYEHAQAGDPHFTLLRAGGPAGRLDRPALPLLLLDERLAIVVLRGERSRGRPGAGVRRAGGWTLATAGLVRVRRARIQRRPAAAALGRSRAAQGRRPPGRPRGRGIARGLRGARRVRDDRPAARHCARSARRSARSACSGATCSARPTRATCRSASRPPCRSRSSTTRAVTGPSSARAARRGTRSRSATRRSGSTATAGCGASTRGTGSAASAPRRDPSTRGPGRSGSPGTTRSASWG